MIAGIIEILKENTGIQGLVGQKNATPGEYKIYPVVAPQTEKAPYITVNQTSRVPQCKGSSSGNYGFDVWATNINYEDSKTLGDAVITVLDQQSATTSVGYNFSFINLVNQQERFEKVEEGVMHVNIVSFECQAEYVGT
jgi:hypothetical protein